MDGQDRFATFKISTLTLNSKIFGKKQNIKHFPKSVRNVEWIK